MVNRGRLVIAKDINSVAVLGAGTMGAGIAGLCAQHDRKVLMLDVSTEIVEKGLKRVSSGRLPAVDDLEKAQNITLGTFDRDLDKIKEYDWICEAVIEDLGVKRGLMKRIEPLRKHGSVVSTNTSGILLSEITKDLSSDLSRKIAVTHFFNPVKIMRLMELVPGKDTEQDVIDTLSAFCGGVLGKGVVYAKDTVNFIGNRIGCYLILMGLHKARRARKEGLSTEIIDATISMAFGMPKTGLFGLVDLIGLDVMDFVGKNLAENLPANDLGIKYVKLPAAEQVMLDHGQIGRKSGGGFYRVSKLENGSRVKEVFDLEARMWREAVETALNSAHSTPAIIFSEDVVGKFCWEVMGGTLCYAADLIPEISDDIVNIDRAMRWGFGWKQGPFELLDSLEPSRFIDRLEIEGSKLPKMLGVMRNAGVKSFYRNDAQEYLGIDGSYHPV